MRRTSYFDVLIVYSSTSAQSADSRLSGNTPFAKSAGRAEYADSYGYLLNQCAQLGLKAAFTTLNNIIGAGRANSYWQYLGGKWSRHIATAYSRVIFDKCSPRTLQQIKLRKLLFASTNIVPFNEVALYQLFFDKLSLYDQLHSVTIPTVEIVKGDSSSVESACERLDIIKSIHNYPSDFGVGYILKDRYGSGGNNIHQIESSDSKLIKQIVDKNPNSYFVLQPMLLFENGFRYKKARGRTEIRLIFMKEKLVQVYLRIAPPREFLCNAHQGGQLVYIPIKEVPTKVTSAATEAIALLPNHNSLYSLDFVVSDNGNPYLLEGNTGPGLNWDSDNGSDVAGTKALMRIIAKELAQRVIRNYVKTNISSNQYPLVNQ